MVAIVLLHQVQDHHLDVSLELVKDVKVVFGRLLISLIEHMVSLHELKVQVAKSMLVQSKGFGKQCLAKVFIRDPGGYFCHRGQDVWLNNARKAVFQHWALVQEK